jgi:hypothetical protein
MIIYILNIYPYNMTVNNNTNMSNYALIIIIHKNLISFSFVIKVAIVL